MTKNTELIVFEKLKPLEVFTEKGTESILSQIKKEKDNFKGDISTAKGRDEIRSFARKFATSKSKLDDLGKQLVSGWKEQAKVVDNERKKIRETLDEWRDEVRQPVTDFENKEKKRIEDFQDRIKDMESYKNTVENIELHQVTQFICELDKLYKNCKDWQEFSGKAKNTFEDVNSHLSNLKEREEKREAEFQILKKATEERQKKAQKDREEQIIRETEENIRRVEREKAERVEKAAKEEKYRLEAEKKEQEDKAKVAEARQALTERRNQLLTIGVAFDVAKDGYFILPEATQRVELTGSQLLLKDDKEWGKTLESVTKEVEINKKALAKKVVLLANQKARVVRFRLEDEKKAAEQARINAENRSIEAAKKAKEEKKQAEIRAEREQEEAVRLERTRAQAEKQKEIDDAKAREADIKHRTEINNTALEAIRGNINGMFSDEAIKMAKKHSTEPDYAIAKIIITAIAKGKIPHIFIKY